MPYTPNKTGSNIVKAALDKDPNLPALTLARRLHTQNPGVWPNVDAARNSIRYYTGTAGQTKRKGATHPRPTRKAGEDWTKFLPEAWREIEWEKPFRIPHPARILNISDTQVPFHDLSVIKLWINYGRDNGADVVLLNGDIVDHYSLSDYLKDPRMRNYPAEVRAGRDLLKAIRKAFPDARIIYKHGNHEDRFERYMTIHCPELLGIPEFTWDAAYGVGDLGIEIVRDQRTVKAGGLNIYHGHEFKLSGAAMPARMLYLRAKVNALAGDVHRSQHWSEPDADGKLISTFTTGCLCYKNPPFMRHNKWNHGGAFITTDAKGAFTVDNKRIIDGVVY